MSFTDYIFFPLLALFVLLYYLVPASLGWLILLLTSVLFYCTYGAELLPFAAGAVIAAFFSGLLMENCYRKTEETIKSIPDIGKEERLALGKAAKKKCRYFLWIGIFCIFGMLCYTKSQRWISEIPVLQNFVWFFSKVYQHIARWTLKFPLSGLLVKDRGAAETFRGYSFFFPLGISYYSMSLVGYLADIYWKKEKADRNILKLALFALYFPKILEGPISKHRDLADQLMERKPFDYDRACRGMQRMMWGYFKKLCIADRLSMMVTPVFSNSYGYGGSILMLSAVLGVFQMYCDFSGCMDIALGISEILGIEVAENFKRPFHSRSAAEFWRRWHITLGVWFKDYVYLPLVVSPRVIKLSAAVRKRFGKRPGKAVSSIIPITTVWILTGLWHATGLNFVIWGLYWGVLIIISNIFEPEFKKLAAILRIPADSAGFDRFRKLRTFVIFAIARVMTLSPGIREIAAAFSRMLFSFEAWHLTDGSIYNYGLERPDFWLVVLLICFLLWVECRQEQGVVFRDRIGAMKPVRRWCVYMGALLFILVFGIYGAGYQAGSFIYMNY